MLLDKKTYRSTRWSGQFALTICFLLFWSLCFGQRDAQWIAGAMIQGQLDSLVLFDFRSDPPILNTHKSSNGNIPQVVYFRFSSSAISTDNGDLKAYSDNKTIFNGQHEVIQNGEDMINFDYNPAMHGAMFLPYPGHPDSTLFITHKWDLEFDSLMGGSYSSCYDNHYSVINHRANGGSGKVVDRMHIYEQGKLCCGGFSAVQHANGRDWWFVNTEIHSNRWHRYLLSPDGFTEQVVQDLQADSLTHEYVHASFSPDGNWLVRYWYFPTGSVIDTYRFDRCSGLLSDFKRTRVTYNPYSLGGATFSPNNRFLYVSTLDTLWQFDMQQPDFEATRTVVGVNDKAQVDVLLGPGELLQQRWFFVPYLAVNGKIYITSYGQFSVHMHVINQPNEVGAACDFVQRGFITPQEVAWVMPKMPHYTTGKLIGSPCDTLTSSTAVPDKARFNLKLDPNPADAYTLAEITSLDQKSETDLTIRIYDNTGVVLSEYVVPNQTTQLLLEVTKVLPEGVYFVTLSQGATTLATERLVVLHQ
jgi:hypothetical protein